MAAARGVEAGPARPEDLFERARRVIPGGVNSPARSFRAVGGTPPFLVRGSGSRVWDTGGREYLDCVGSWGPLAVGHSHPRVVEAVRSAAERGTSFGAPTEGETELAELIAGAFPSVDMVRLVNSGTEATMSAVRLARAFTGRSRVVKFAGCYHGHADGLLVQAGSGAATHGVPSSPGVPESYAGETLVAAYNDLPSVEMWLREYPESVAAVIVEPVAANMGVVPPRPGFLEGLRELADGHGALLVFDEVITGFRVAYGGAQERYGVRADLTCLGKVIGGGLPVGAYGGRREVMELVSPSGPVYQAGTLSGNPLATAAGVATLRLLREPGTYERLERLGRRLGEGLLEAVRGVGVPGTVNRAGSLLTLFFSPGPVRGWEDAAGADAGRYARYFRGMLERGVYMAPSAFEAVFLSTAHSEEEIDRVVRCAGEALRECR